MVSGIGYEVIELVGKLNLNRIDIKVIVRTDSWVEIIWENISGESKFVNNLIKYFLLIVE